MKTNLWEYEDQEIILFWGGILSNWYVSVMEIDGIQYNCVEQFMMSEKAKEFGDYDIQLEVMKTKNPREQKALGRKVFGFNKHQWTQVCYDRVLPGVKAKFEQNNELAGLLLTTQDKLIAEASPYDKIWGIGLAPDDYRAQDPDNWNGYNLLGKMIMQVRNEMKGIMS